MKENEEFGTLDEIQCKKSGEYCDLTSDGSRSAANENSEKTFYDSTFVHVLRQLQ
jgi:hypothetical protein